MIFFWLSVCLFVQADACRCWWVVGIAVGLRRGAVDHSSGTTWFESLCGLPSHSTIVETSTPIHTMKKRDSDSGHSPSASMEAAHEKGVYNGDTHHAEQAATLDRFPDPDEGKSDEEKALIVCVLCCTQ